MESTIEIKKRTEEALKSLSDYKYFLDGKIGDVYKEMGNLGEINGKVDEAKKELDRLNKLIASVKLKKESEDKSYAEEKQKNDKEIKSLKDEAKKDREEAKNVLTGAQETQRITSEEKEKFHRERQSWETNRAKIAELAR